MHTYRVNATRDGKWWMITVPELRRYVTSDGAINLSDTTQARRLSEVPNQARDFICTVIDKAPSEVGLDITIEVDGIDITARANKLRHDRELADRYTEIAQAEAKALARDLASHGVAVRDVGEVLGMSFQRAQQLISAAR
ncbi:HicB family toxin-antitoxin system [Mycobacterium sp. Lab-001]|uniref:HicB family toxin-antitoxin system n=1 Tax=Mycobacterium sp. Lab-001 TaxID=3410136 RepID=UPI003D181ABA